MLNISMILKEFTLFSKKQAKQLKQRITHTTHVVSDSVSSIKILGLTIFYFNPVLFLVLLMLLQI